MSTGPSVAKALESLSVVVKFRKEAADGHYRGQLLEVNDKGAHLIKFTTEKF
jgi:hypothetical protein